MLKPLDSIETLDTFFCPECRKEYFDEYYPEGKHWIVCENCGEEFYMIKETTCVYRTERIFQ